MKKNIQNRKLNPEEVAISVDGVSKYFSASNGQRSMKQLFTSLLSAKNNQKKPEGYWVLNDISFQIKKGEFFGIIGRNGSGKSTLLKMIAGVYSPSGGHISVNGNLVPFIELGVGFNPELSGRDNVFLNGALLGFTRKEIKSMYDEIVSFAELDEHMDVKLKNYSSGMQVRLAFSIAIRADSDILLIDEVLAVGDSNFQTKCLSIFREYKLQNKTVILVSHDIDTIQEFCEKVAVIDSGHVKYCGDTDNAISHYVALNQKNRKTDKSEKMNIKDYGAEVQILKQNEISAIFTVGDELCIRLLLPEEDRLENVGVAIIRADGVYCFGTNTVIDRVDISRAKELYFRLPNLTLLPGTYTVAIGLFGQTDHDVIAYIPNVASFEVLARKNTPHGVALLQHDWRIN